MTPMRSNDGSRPKKSPPSRSRRLLTSHLSLLTCLLLLLTACRRGMVDQQHLKPLAEDNFFADGAGSRVPPQHTVARGQIHDDDQFFTGKTGDYLVATMPAPVTRELLDRGRERFGIFCAVCHGRTG